MSSLFRHTGKIGLVNGISTVTREGNIIILVWEIQSLLYSQSMQSGLFYYTGIDAGIDYMYCQFFVYTVGKTM